jgi:hypothetical protein
MPAYAMNNNQMNTSQFEPSVPRLGGQQFNLLPWDPTQRSLVLYFGVFLKVGMYPLLKMGIRHSVNTKCTYTTGTNFDPEGTE